MKKYYLTTIVLFFLLLAIPMLAFNREENVRSEIDNRMLTNNPFGENEEHSGGRGLSEALMDYVADRIGFRSDMIRQYTAFHDRVFGIMIHPSYVYGKDGYVFFPNAGGGPELTDYHRSFAKMVIAIERYCDERDVPFLFVFDPIKNAVIRDKLPDGIHFNNQWKEGFFSLLDEGGVRWVDTTEILTRKWNEGEKVFNPQYNAGHWNDLGAFYAVNEMLSALEDDFPALTPNELSEFSVRQKLNTSLPVSEFPISEYETVISRTAPVSDVTKDWADEVELSEEFRRFKYIRNEEQLEKGAPRTLVFQGSYMNEMGHVFLENRLGEYISVHGYQNVLDFEYYFDLFEPECVIFETAEYVFSDYYYSQERMESFDLPHPGETLEDCAEMSADPNTARIVFEKGKTVTVMSVSGLPEGTDRVCAIMGEKTYWLRPREGAFTLSLRTGAFEEGSVIAADTQMRTKYVLRIPEPG